MQSTSSLFRSKTHRLPSSRPGYASATATAGGGSVISATTLGAPVELMNSRPTASSSSAAATAIEVGSNLSVFLTNLRLLDLDLREDWPGITVRTFDTKDSSHSQKKRIQSVEWALFHLFCLWDSEEAREKLHPLFPPNDQVQSVSLRAALLRALEQAKKNGALGRDAIIRKTMLDECRGERLEEVLAVFSSAVLKRAVALNYVAVRSSAPSPAIAQTLALEPRGYSSERTQLNALILAHRSSLRKSLAEKKAAQARYADFSELLDIKQRRLARQGELAAALDDQIESHSSSLGGVASLSESEKLDTWRVVRNNWSGNEQWMDALLYGGGGGGQDGLRDLLLKTPFDRVWRRVQAGRLGELESRGGCSNLLEQLEKSVEVQSERLQRWKSLRQKLFSEQIRANTSAAAAAQAATSGKGSYQQKGIDLGFCEHGRLRPAMAVTARQQEEQTPILEGRYADMMARLQTGLQSIQTTQNPSLAAFLHSQRATSVSTKGGNASDISDLEDEEEDMMPPPPQVLRAPATPLLETQAAEATAGQPSPPILRSAQRVLLTKKKSMTLRIDMYQSDEEPELMASPSPRLRRAGTRIIKGPEMAVVAERHFSPPAPRSPPIRHIHTPTPIRPPLPPQMILHSEQATPPHMILHSAEEERHFQRDSEKEEEEEEDEAPPSLDAQPSSSPSEELADEILVAMNTASPSPYKRPRHTLSLAERTRMSMARSSQVFRNDYNGIHGDGDEDDDEPDLEEVLAPPRHRSATTTINTTKAMDKAFIGQPIRPAPAEGSGSTAGVPYEDLVTRTRKSMAGFEASKKKAQMERRRSLRKSKTSLSVGLAVSGHRDYFPPVDEGDSTLVLAEELMSGGQDDAEAIFRSRPKIKMSPIPSPNREFE